MENIIVAVVVAAALGFSIFRFVRIFRGRGGCGCGDGCSCSAEKKSCCGGRGEFPVNK